MSNQQQRYQFKKDDDTEKYYDCMEENNEEEEDEDTYRSDKMFDLICTSPSNFRTERTKKRDSKKNHPKTTTKVLNETGATVSDSETVLEAGVSEPININSVKAKELKKTLKLNFGPSTILDTNAVNKEFEKKIIRQNKALARVHSLPSFGGVRPKELRKYLNNPHRSTLYSESSDGKNEINSCHDIDDDLINCFHEQKNDNMIDDYEKRRNFYEKFSLIIQCMLKPALSSDNYRLNSYDSFTPSTPIITTPHPILPPPPPPPSCTRSSLPSYVYDYYYVYNNNQQPSSEQLIAHSNENLWYNLYDFFVNYNKRSKTLDEIKENLENTRSKCVGPTINGILSLNLSIIANMMQYDLESGKLENVSDYRRLNESPKYICKLSYLYCYIEDILNKVGYMESLFPSLKALENYEPRYASEDFSNRIKTLLLWYNIMTDLMRQCDLFGRLLGFTKRECYHQLWTWFDKNQNYSRRDYEKIQLFILNQADRSVDSIPQSAPILKNSKSSVNAFLSPQISLNNVKKSSTCEPLSAATNSTVTQAPKFQRQVSFELSASKQTKNLIYNRGSIDDSIIITSATQSSPKPLSRQNSGRNSISGSDSFSGITQGVSTPLPQKLQNFFSFQSSSSSRKSNDSVPASLYASLVHESFDDEENDDEKETMSSIKSSANYSTGEKIDTSVQPTPLITREKIYQDFIHKRLCKHGLVETCKQILNMIGNTLPRTRSALEAQNSDTSSKNSKNSTLQFFSYHWMPLHTKCRDYISKYNNDNETKQFSINCKQFNDLCLPSFRPLYLFLINCILDLMKICMNMYIDMYARAHTDYNFSFSLLSTEQLTKECRECIEHAILVRQYYHYMIFTVFQKEELEKNPIENDLENYDADLKELINIYLKYVSNWVSDTLMMNSLSLNVLEKEWNFCKNNLCYVSIGEDSFAKSFCTINCSIIESLSHYLNEIDNKYKQPLIDSLVFNDNHMSDHESDENTRVASSMFELGPSTAAEYDNESNDDNDVNFKCNELKLQIRELRDRTMKALTFCRSFMNDLELAAKYEVKSNLKNLLEHLRTEFHLIKLSGNKICDSSFMIFVPRDFGDDKKKILRLLYMTSARDDGTTATSDVKSKITTTCGIKNTSSTNLNKKSPLCSAVSTPMSGSKEDPEINSRYYHQSRRFTTANLNDTARFNNQQQAQQINSEGSNTLPNSPQTDNDSYLLYLSVSTKDQNNKEDSTWKGFEITIEASIDIKMKLFQHKTDEITSYLYLVVGQPQYLSDKKIDLKSKLRSHITLVKEKTSFHPNIAIELDELNTKILKNLPRDAFKFIESLENDTSKPFQADLIISSQHNSTKSLIKKFLLEIWRVCYNYGIELHIECVKFLTQGLHKDFSIGLAEFCKFWCNYVLQKTEEGYGRTAKPSWARKGFQLMNEVFKPQNSVHLTEHEFDELRKSVEICIKHVIGTKREKPLVDTGPFDVTDASIKRKKIYIATYSMNDKATTSINPVPHLLQSQSSVVLRAQEFLQEQQLKTLLPPHKRFSLRCKDCDDNRAYDLRENKLIGKTIDRQENCFNINQAKISVRRVDFRWQRGNKIGIGSTGVVYACVNLDTGEMMAMKEIQYKPNDLQMIKSLADEIANIEGIKHENLVKFYGVELHKKEILIFMEFCGDKCTLDQISRESSGLPEELIRSYTNSLLKAVFTLHENNIIHRDIKGANIFLKTEDSKDSKKKTTLKLGDFGSSIRLKTDSFTNFGLLAQGFMGTLAYMAPEVMMSGGYSDSSASGYTFSADIWSVGCVVIEMFTGKRPWCGLKDENIMYKVFKDKEKPPFPTNINSEATDFLKRCLEFDANLRWTASELLRHVFVKIAEDRF